MKVKATALGYYGHKRRKAGEVFTLSKSEHFSKRWMVEVKKGAKVSEPEPDDEIEESDLGDEGESSSDQEVI